MGWKSLVSPQADLHDKFARPRFSHVRPPCNGSMQISGRWCPQTCGGPVSALNPQVQIETAKLTLVSIQLDVSGPCGKSLEVWIVRHARWGHRRHALSNVEAWTRASISVACPHVLAFDVELPGRNIFNIVLACEGACGAAGVDAKDSGAGPDDFKELSRTQFPPPAPCSVTSDRTAAQADTTELCESLLSFKLFFKTTAAFVRGPMLLPRDVRPPPVAHSRSIPWCSTGVNDTSLRNVRP